MLDIVTRFIGKRCMIYSYNCQLSGVITEVSDGWISVDSGIDVEAVNLDYIIRIKDYPEKKKDKKKVAQ